VTGFSRDAPRPPAGLEWVAAAVAAGASALGGAGLAWGLPVPPSTSMVPGFSSATVWHVAGWLALGCLGATLVTTAAAASTALRLSTASPDARRDLGRVVAAGAGLYLAGAALLGLAVVAAMWSPFGMLFVLAGLTLPVAQWVVVVPAALALARRPERVVALQLPAAVVTGLGGLGYALLWASA
jgi:hypothetical protein